MKTHYTLLYLLTAFLSVFALPADAQQTQDALYIFRNDGGFNAFFYADIDRIEYSKIDTFGVEQSDYVVQEVYALDSCFRIPISAIDSVAFVTPETEYKADVNLIDRSISDYIVASDSSSWFRLSSSTPSSLIPKKGDKMVIKDRSIYLPYGMGGIVASVDNGSEGVTVTIEKAELSDIYDRLVLKFAGGENGNNTRAINRIAFEDVDLPKVSGTYQIEGSIEAIKALKETTSVSIDGMGSLSCSIKPHINALRAFLVLEKGSLSPISDFFLDSQFENNIQLNLKGGFTARIEVPLGGKEYSYENCEVNTSYGPFIEVSKSGMLNYEWSNTTGYTVSLGYSKGHPSFIFESETLNGISSFKNIESEITATIGNYGKVEIELKDVENLGFKFVLGLDFGIKAESHDPVTAKNIADMDFEDTWKLYEKLNKDTLIYINNPIVNYQCTWAVGPYTNGSPKTLGSKQLFIFGRVPNFSDIDWELDEKCPWRGKLKSKIKNRNMWEPVPYGFIVQEQETGKTVDIWYDDKGYEGGEFTMEYTFEGLDPDKKYVGTPIMEHRGMPMMADIEKEFTLGPPMILMDNRKIELPEVEGTKTLPLKTNISDLRYTSDADWFEFTYYKELAEIHIIYDALPDQLELREATIVGVGYDSEGNEIGRDEITVIQKRLNINNLKLSPAEFKIGVKGDTKTVTVSSINVSNIQVSTKQNFIHPTIKDNIITIVIDENPGEDEREGEVEVSGILTDTNQKIERYIYITQDGTEDGSRNGEGLFTSGMAATNLTPLGSNYSTIHMSAPGTQELHKDIGYTLENGDQLQYRSVGSWTDASSSSRTDHAWRIYLNIDKGDDKSIYSYKLKDGAVSEQHRVYKKDYEMDMFVPDYTVTSVYYLKDFDETRIRIEEDGSATIIFEPDIDVTKLADYKLTDYMTELSYEKTGEHPESYTLNDVVKQKYAGEFNFEAWTTRIELKLADGTPLLEPKETHVEFEDGYHYNHTIFYTSNYLVSDITVTSSVDWITIETVENARFIFRVPINDSQSDREGYIYLSGKLPNGQTITRTIPVKQPYTRIFDDRWETSEDEKAELPSEAILSELANHGMQLHIEATPPAINGVFEMHPAILLYTNKPEAGQAGDIFEGSYIFKIATQNEGEPRAKLGIYQEAGEYTAPADEYVCYLGGSGNKFTISNIKTLTNDDPLGTYTITYVTVVSGEVDGNNIKNLQYGVVYLNEDGTIDEVYLSEDQDGVSGPASWNPGEPWD